MASRVELAPISREEAETTHGWRYTGELAVYNFDGQPLDAMLDPANRYFAIHLDGAYVGYVCAGAEARVPGLDPVDGVDDLGWGLAPELVGRGLSRRLLPAAIDQLTAQGVLAGPTLRVAILDWNLRSLAAARNLGFAETGTHLGDEGTFVLMTRRLRRRPADM